METHLEANACREDQLEDVPPALPAKQRRPPGERLPRVPSQYDNVFPMLPAEIAEEIVSKLQDIEFRDEVPPPLPPKRRTSELRCDDSMGVSQFISVTLET